MQTSIPGGGFSAANVAAAAAGIRTAMRFGYPVDPARRPIFVIPAATTDAGLDERSVPFDPDQALPATTTDLPDVLCAYEAINMRNDDLDKATGIAVQAVRLTVTLLQEEWEQIQDCVALRIGGTTYIRWRDNLEYALGPLGVHQIMFRAGDAV